MANPEIFFIFFSLFLILFLYRIWGILPDSNNSDLMLQLCAARSYGQWLFPSGAHNFAGGKAFMKDLPLYVLSVLVKVFKFPDRYRTPIFMISSFHFLSSILIFIILKRIFSLEVSLFATGFYFLNYWPYQITLLGGYQLASQLVLLLLVFIQIFHFRENAILNFSVSGLLFGALMFTSASARKYILIGYFTFCYSFMLFTGINSLEEISMGMTSLMYSVCGLLLTFFIHSFFWKKIFQRLRSSFSRTKKFYSLNLNQEFGLGYYERRLNTVKTISQQFLFSFFGVVAIAVAISSFLFFKFAMIYGLGFSIACLMFWFPRFKSSIAGYVEYYSIGHTGRFNAYREYLEQVDGPIKHGWRAKQSGLLLLLKFYFKTMPIHFIVFIGFSAGALISGEYKNLIFWILLFFSLSPIIWGEVTEGPQIGRSYFPSLLGICFFSAYSLNSLWEKGGDWEISLIIILLLFFIHTSYAVFYDLIPCRLLVKNLYLELKKNKISEFATYDNPYNHYFVDVLEFNFPNEFKIHRVPSIQEGRKKASLFVLPGTSSKSMHMESVGYAIKNGDFELDNDLNRLLETKDIQNLAVSKFRTMGNSFFWVYESEITSYRKLMLKEFDNTHYFRSFAWVLKF